MTQVKILVCCVMLILLTNEREGLSDIHSRVEAGLTQVISELTTHHSDHSAAQVRKR